MRKKYEAQMTIEDHDFKALGEYFPEDRELTKMSAALDENPAILEAVGEDLRIGLRGAGAWGMTVEQVLRSAIIYQIKGYPYRELADRIADSYNFRKFTRFYSGKVPHFSNFEKAIKKIRPETFARINELLVAHAIKKKVEAGVKLRGDATVVETNIHYPTDGALLEDSARVLDRLMKAAKEECRARFEYHDRTRRAKKLSYQIVMAKGKSAERTRRLCYRELLAVMAEVIGMARGCRAALSAPGRSFAAAECARFLRAEFDEYLPLAEQVMRQCERRVQEGEKVPAAEKIVSIFEPHTDIIRRGKSQCPTEFGHKLMVATGASGLVLQYEVCEGNPDDGAFLEAMLQKHLAQFGHGPRDFTADRRFYSADNEKLAAAAPFMVERVAIPKPGRRDPERASLEKQRWFKKLLRFRAGIEGGLSTLLRCFGLGRCLWRGLQSFQSWVGLAVFTYNLRKIAALI